MQANSQRCPLPLQSHRVPEHPFLPPDDLPAPQGTSQEPRRDCPLFLAQRFNTIQCTHCFSHEVPQVLLQVEAGGQPWPGQVRAELCRWAIFASGPSHVHRTPTCTAGTEPVVTHCQRLAVSIPQREMAKHEFETKNSTRH